MATSEALPMDKMGATVCVGQHRESNIATAARARQWHTRRSEVPRKKNPRRSTCENVKSQDCSNSQQGAD